MRALLRAPAAMPLAILALTLAGLGLIAVTSGYSHFVIALVALIQLLRIQRRVPEYG